ncbi:hypothetical protein HMPREF9540_01370, partial [Escherichia coli MS 115-1]
DGAFLLPSKCILKMDMPLFSDCWIRGQKRNIRPQGNDNG